MKDWRGVVYDRIPDNVSRDAIAEINDYLFQIGASFGRISRGEQPNSSGGSLGGPLLDDYWKLSGRLGNQVGYGGTAAGGYAKFVSTKHPTKGYLLFGEAENSVYDETNDRWGFGTASPSARLHVNGASSAIQPSSTIGAGGWVQNTGATLHGAINEDTPSDVQWIRSPGTGSATCTFGLDTAIPTTATSVTVRFWAMRDTANPVDPDDDFFFTVNREDGSSAQSSTFVTQDLSTVSFQPYEVVISGFIGTSANTNRLLISDTPDGVGSPRVMIAWVEIVLGSGGDSSPLQYWSLDDVVINLVDSSGRVGLGTGEDDLSHALTLGDVDDPTKQAAFSLASITAANRRVLTIQDANYTIAGIDLAQLWSALQRFPDNMFQVVGSTTVSKTVAFEVDGATASTQHTLVFQQTAARSSYFPNVTGTLLSIGGTGNLPAAGTLVYGAGTTTALAELTIGASGTILTSSGTAPQWSTNASVVDQARTWTTLQKFQDTLFQIVDSADNTRIAMFEAGNISTGTTRTYNLQNASYTIAGTNIQQAFSEPQEVLLAADTDVAFIVTPFPGGSRSIMMLNDELANPMWEWDHNGFLTVSTPGGNNYGGITVNAGAASYFVNTGNNKIVFLELDGMTAGQSHQLSFINTGNRESFFPNVTGTLLSIGGAGNLPAAGTLVYGAGTATAMAELTIGASGTILTSSGTAPQWSTAESIVDQARTWDTLQTFLDSTFKVVGSATASKTFSIEVDGASVNADARLLWTGAVDADFTLPPTTTTLAGLAITQTFTGANTFNPSTDVVPVSIIQPTGGTGDMFSVTNESAAQIMSVDVNGITNFFSIKMWPDGVVGSGFYAEVVPPVATANRTITLPDATGTVTLNTNTATLTGKTLAGVGGIRCSTSTAASVKFQNGTSAVRFMMLDLTAINADAQVDYKGLFQSGTIPLTGNVDTAGAGTATENVPGKFDATGQTASITATVLMNGSTVSAGHYIVSVTVGCVTAGAAADTVDVTVSWTENAIARTRTLAAAVVLNNTANDDQIEFPVYSDASTDISFTTTYTDAGGGTAGAYDLHVSVTRLRA